MGGTTQDLEWAYTAETVAILFVQVVMAYFANKRVQTLLDGALAARRPPSPAPPPPVEVQLYYLIVSCT